MSMTSLLTLASMFNSLTYVTPPISYITKMDVWMVACITTVFTILLEFTIVIIIRTTHEKSRVEADDQAKSGLLTSKAVAIVERTGTAAVFVAFAVFNMFYWADIYTVMESHSGSGDGKYQFCRE